MKGRVTRRFGAVRVFVILGLLLAAFTFSTANVKAAPKLSRKKIVLIKGQKQQLQIRGTAKKIRWQSENKSVVKVNKKGKLKAVGEGTANIYANVGKKSYRCKVTVEAPELNVKKLALQPKQKAVIRLHGTKGKVRFSSSNKSVAAVTAKGVIKAKKKGKAVITAKVRGEEYKCKVTVKKNVSGGHGSADRKTDSPVNHPGNTQEPEEPKGSGSITGMVMGPDIIQPFLLVNDENAIVLLVPASGAKGFTFTGNDLSAFNNAAYGTYATRVDSDGRYWINNVTEGTYQLFIISMKSHGNIGVSPTIFRQREDMTPSLQYNYYRFPQVIRQYFNETTASQIENWAMSRTVIGTRVTIAEGVTTQFGYDFKEYGKFF